jgi:cyclase
LKRIIPSLLLYNKKLVKGIKFQNYKNAGNPATTVSAFDSQKADEIFIIDLNSYLGEKDIDYETIENIAKISSTPMTVGGGINSLQKAIKLFSCGADKIYLNSVLFENKKIIDEIKYIYGSQSIVAGMNLVLFEKNYFLMEDKSKKINPVEYANLLQDYGVGEIKITFLDTEGTKKGIDLNYCKLLVNKLKLPLIFDGGIGNLIHLEEIFLNGVDAVALGTIITFNDYNIIKIKQHLLNTGISVRV